MGIPRRRPDARHGRRQRHPRLVLRRGPLVHARARPSRTGWSCSPRAPTCSTSAASPPARAHAGCRSQDELDRVLPGDRGARRARRGRQRRHHARGRRPRGRRARRARWSTTSRAGWPTTTMYGVVAADRRRLRRHALARARGRHGRPATTTTTWSPTSGASWPRASRRCGPAGVRDEQIVLDPGLGFAKAGREQLAAARAPAGAGRRRVPRAGRREPQALPRPPAGRAGRRARPAARARPRHRGGVRAGRGRGRMVRAGARGARLGRCGAGSRGLAGVRRHGRTRADDDELAVDEDATNRREHAVTTDEQWEGGVLDERRPAASHLDNAHKHTHTTPGPDPADGHHGHRLPRRVRVRAPRGADVRRRRRRAPGHPPGRRPRRPRAHAPLRRARRAGLGRAPGEPVDLIETVAERIAATVLAHAIVQAVDVSVHKPQAPIEVPFGDVVVRDPPRPRQAARGRAVPAAAQAAPRPPRRARPHADGVVPGDPGARCARGRRRRRSRARAGPPAAPTAVAPRRRAVRRGSRDPGRRDRPATIPWRQIVPPLGAGLPPAPARCRAEGPTVPAASSTPTPSEALTGDVPTVGTEPGRAARAPSSARSCGRAGRDPVTVVDVVLALGANLGAAAGHAAPAVADLSAHTRRRGGRGLAARPHRARRRPGAARLPQRGRARAHDARRRATCCGSRRRSSTRTAASGTSTGARARSTSTSSCTARVMAVTDDLELPHPRAHERAFVLQPWAQVAPHAVLPGLGGGPVAALAATAPDRDGVRWLALDWLTAPSPRRHRDGAATRRAEAPDRDARTRWQTLLSIAAGVAAVTWMAPAVDGSRGMLPPSPVAGRSWSSCSSRASSSCWVGTCGSSCGASGPSSTPSAPPAPRARQGVPATPAPSWPAGTAGMLALATRDRRAGQRWAGAAAAVAVGGASCSPSSASSSSGSAGSRRRRRVPRRRASGPHRTRRRCDEAASTARDPDRLPVTGWAHDL